MSEGHRSLARLPKSQQLELLASRVIGSLETYGINGLAGELEGRVGQDFKYYYGLFVEVGLVDTFAGVKVDQVGQVIPTVRTKANFPSPQGSREDMSIAAIDLEAGVEFNMQSRPLIWWITSTQTDEDGDIDLVTLLGERKRKKVEIYSQGKTILAFKGFTYALVQSPKLARYGLDARIIENFSCEQVLKVIEFIKSGKLDEIIVGFSLISLLEKVR